MKIYAPPLERAMPHFAQNNYKSSPPYIWAISVLTKFIATIAQITKRRRMIQNKSALASNLICDVCFIKFLW